jgi:hypothetical protein
MKIKRLDFFSGTNPYHSTHYFIEQLSNALERNGVACRTLDMQEGLFDQYVKQAKRKLPDMTCSFSYLRYPPGAPWVCDLLQVPHLTYGLDGVVNGVDHFFHPHAFLSTVDKEDCKELQSIADGRLLFLPHAVEKEFEADFACERPYEILFCATYLDYTAEMESWRSLFSPEVCGAMSLAAELILSERGLSIFMGLKEAFETKRVNISAPVYIKVYDCVERYCKGKDRVNLLRALCDFHVHLFGAEDWSQELQGLSHVTVHLPVSFRESLDLFRKSKIVLNSSPQFRHGSHERVFYGLAAGAAVVTNENPYLQNHFGHDNGVIYYLPGREQQLVEQVKALLANEPFRRQAADEGRSRVMQAHTWDHRAVELLSQWKL